MTDKEIKAYHLKNARLYVAFLNTAIMRAEEGQYNKTNHINVKGAGKKIHEHLAMVDHIQSYENDHS